MNDKMAILRRGAEAAGTFLWSLSPQDWKQNADCPSNCSVHGECLDGKCFCEVQFDGETCTEPNLYYHAGFSCVFFVIALASFIQLVICISSEYKRLKVRAFFGAFKITHQKFLYFFAFLGAIFKAIYFMQTDAEGSWALTLLRASYPVILTCFSLIVCFWAEVFHLGFIDPSSGKKFLSKSLVGFLVFNLVLYSVLASEFVLTYAVATTVEERHYYFNIYNMCYAFLFLVAVTFFLIYGVEVYFKVRGEFVVPPDTVLLSDLNQPTASHCLMYKSSKNYACVKTKLDRSASTDLDFVDNGQLVQSRIGLVSQAFMVLLTICLLMSDTLGELWRDKVGLFSRNTHDLVFRIAEIGVVLWFPCVLWNCMRPEELWILNPRRLLKDFVSAKRIDIKPPAEVRPSSPALSSQGTCWICYDCDRPEMLINPCACKGDTGIVHHDCLRRWLVESCGKEDAMFCKVCLAQYVVAKVSFKEIPWSVALTPGHCLKTAGVLVVISGVGIGAWMLIDAYPDPRISMAVVGAALILEYLCARYIAMSTLRLFQRSKMSALQIIGNPVSKAAVAGGDKSADLQKLTSQYDIFFDT